MSRHRDEPVPEKISTEEKAESAELERLRRAFPTGPEPKPRAVSAIARDLETATAALDEVANTSELEEFERLVQVLAKLRREMAEAQQRTRPQIAN